MSYKDLLVIVDDDHIRVSGFLTSPIFPTDAAAVQSRYADLVVLGQLDPEEPLAPVNNPRPEDIVLVCREAHLATPYVGRYEAIGQRVLVAWDASREATRAVSDAMPLLASASSVTILTIDPATDRTEHGDIPGTDIALHLALHGVNTRTEKTISGGIGIGDVLLSRASDLGADLLVMGAYGHSALWARERFGATGVYGLAAIVGLTDIDPFVLSIASGGAMPLPGNTAAAAVLIAASSNHVLKAAYTAGFAVLKGRPRPRGD